MAATLLSPLNVHSQVATPSTTGVNGVVFYTGTDQDIHEMYWVGNSYVDANLMASSGSGMQVSPGTTPNPDTHGSVWYVAADQCVHWMAFDGTKWLDANLMASSGSAMRVAAGTNVSTNNNNYIYYVGTDQDIHQLFWGGTQYLDADLMTSSGSGMQVAPGTSPTADTLGDVWYVGTDQCVHWMSYNGTQWLDANWMTSSGSGMQVAPGTSLATNNNTLIYYIGTDHDVHELFWGGSNYLDANLMASSGSGMQVLPNTSPIADTLGDIWYTGTDQDVHWMAYNGTKWLDANWMTSSGSGEYVALNTNLSATSNGILLYVGADQDVHEMYWGGNHYLDANLMASTGSGMTASIPRTVTVQNLTNPSWGANFNVGDTFSVTIQGPGNLPVVLSQSPGSTTQAGYTSATGTFTMTATENTGNIGSYTQVWSVGSLAASPSISYIVGQLGNTGTISTTSTAQAEGDYVTGISTLSINNGYINTYSSTELNYGANLYYDAGTVATLFDNGTQINQLSGTSFAMMSGNANAWDDYDLQTDHYVEAFDNSGVYYNPLYFGEDGCDGEIETGTDCTLGSGEGSYVLAEAELYLGSTIADQEYIPQDGTVPAFPASLYDNFLGSSGLPNPGPVVFKKNVFSWFVQLAAVGASVALTESNLASSTKPVPFTLDLEKPPRGDEYISYPGTVNGQARQRAYILRDTLGRPWSILNKVIVGERFTDFLGGTPPAPNGIWYAAVPNPSPEIGQPISESPSGEMTDHYGLGGAAVGFIQYYYAYGFQAPSWLSLSGFSLPGLPGSLPGGTPGGLVLPLWIHDQYNGCEASLGGGFTALPAQTILLAPSFVGIDGDMGPSTKCLPIL